MRAYDRARMHRALDRAMDAETGGYYERSGPYELEVEPERGEFSAIVTKHGITIKSAVRHTYNEAVAVGKRLLSQVPMAMDAAPKYEVRKSRYSDAWAVFEVGDDLPLTGWTNSKAKAMITARVMNGGTVVKVKSKTGEAAAREVAKRTELNPVVRNYFKLDS